MRKFLRFAVRTVKVLFIVLCVYVGSLFFRQEQIPDRIVTYCCDRLSGGGFAMSVGSVDFGFAQGIRIHRVSAFNCESKRALEPVFAAELVTVRPFERVITVVGARVPRLHDGYYEVGSITEPIGENNGRFSLPDLGSFRLELVDPDILGVHPENVTANLGIGKMAVNFTGIHLTWPDMDDKMFLDGFCSIDLAAMRVYGKVDGHARQSNIRPMLGDYTRPVTLDVPVALPYFDAFTEVSKPVPARCAWDVNLVNNEFTIKIGLEPELGRYNGVPMKSAEGLITIHVWWVGGKMEFRTTVDLFDAEDHNGRKLAGQVYVLETNLVRSVHIKADSTLRKDDALNIMGYLNGGTLDCFECLTPPEVVANGQLAPNLVSRHLNDMHGKINCASAKFFGIAVSNVTTRFDYVNDTMRFAEVSARGRTGGEITGGAGIRIYDFGDAKPGRKEAVPNAVYSVNLAYRNGSLEEMSDVFRFVPGKRHGTVSMDLNLHGPLYTNVMERLNGDGRVTVHDGHLAQLPLFSGMTELLAEKVPGVGKVVNLSEARGTFKIVNGVISSDDVRIEGGVFSVMAKGGYDMVNDELDFKVSVRLMKEDSTPGIREIVRMISWPFARVTTEFRVRGKLESPKWSWAVL